MVTSVPLLPLSLLGLDAMGVPPFPLMGQLEFRLFDAEGTETAARIDSSPGAARTQGALLFGPAFGQSLKRRGQHRGWVISIFSNTGLCGDHERLQSIVVHDVARRFPSKDAWHPAQSGTKFV